MLLTPSRDKLKQLPAPPAPFYFVGIGGVGMSGLAQILLTRGYRVCGSDASENERVRYLRELGATIHTGTHCAEHLTGGSFEGTAYAAVVLSTAIRAGHPEWEAAEALNLTLLHRSEMLQLILEDEAQGFLNTVGLSGSHGKTTLTGMTGLALEAAGLDPTVIAGGKIPGQPANVILGNTRAVAVAELDESDGTIVAYNPTVAVLTNLELDHPEHYQGGLEEIKARFQQWFQQWAPRPSETIAKTLIANVDCPTVTSLLQEVPASIQVIRVSFSHEAPLQAPDYWLTDVLPKSPTGGYQGTLCYRGEPLGRLAMSVPGWHNLLNAMFAVIVGRCFGCAFEPMAAALLQFQGMGRRFEVLGRCAKTGALLVDDYAHHPTEVRATLKAAVERLGKRGKVVAVLQPHRYSRLRSLWVEFVHAVAAADMLWVMDVYGAGEPEEPEMNGKALVTAICADGVLRPDKVRYLPKTELGTFQTEMATVLGENDVLITMGAGDVTQVLRHWPVGSVQTVEAVE